MTAKTKLNKTQKEKIIYAVMKALGEKVHEETRPALEKAFSDTYAAFYEKVFGKKGTEADKAFHALAKKGLIECHTSIEIRNVLSESGKSSGWNPVKEDSGLAQFRYATQAKPGLGSGTLAGRHVSYKGFCVLDEYSVVKLARQYPDTLIKKIQYEGDHYATLRRNFESAVTKALSPYKEYAEVATATRAIITGASTVEDLKKDLPDLEELIDTIVTRPAPLPVVISPNIGATLKKLKPIEVKA